MSGVVGSEGSDDRRARIYIDLDEYSLAEVMHLHVKSSICVTSGDISCTTQTDWTFLKLGRVFDITDSAGQVWTKWNNKPTCARGVCSTLLHRTMTTII